MCFESFVGYELHAFVGRDSYGRALSYVACGLGGAEHGLDFCEAAQHYGVAAGQGVGKDVDNVLYGMGGLGCGEVCAAHQLLYDFLLCHDALLFCWLNMWVVMFVVCR